MSAIAFTQFRKHLTEVVEEVCDTGEPLTVTRADGRDVVILPAAEWASMQETMHLLSNPENAARLKASIEAAERGEFVEVDL
ncbi:MAG: type II toxin-antitoxin system Phd/YefM family antitoxin [Pseudomonadota bacterium]